MKYRNKYTYENRAGTKQHVWTCIGRMGALHLHISEQPSGECYGGLEIHYRHPPDYMSNHAPHEKCWLIGGPCWHDGTSLYVTETVIPMWHQIKDHDYWFKWMEGEYVDRFLAAGEEGK